MNIFGYETFFLRKLNRFNVFHLITQILHSLGSLLLKDLILTFLQNYSQQYQNENRQKLQGQKRLSVHNNVEDEATSSKIIKREILEGKFFI